MFSFISSTHKISDYITLQSVACFLPDMLLARIEKSTHKREDPKQYLKAVKIRKITYRVVSNEKIIFSFKNTRL